MKEPGPVICRRTPAHQVAQRGKPGPKCGRCGAAVMSRSDLVGWLEDAPLCGGCLLEEDAALGWALRLVEAAALALAGHWPRHAQSRELPVLLELLKGTRAAVGPLQHRNRRIPLALELLDVIGRRGGGDLLLKVLELLEVVAGRGGGELAGELLDVAAHHGRVVRSTTPRDPGGGKER